MQPATPEDRGDAAAVQLIFCEMTVFSTELQLVSCYLPVMHVANESPLKSSCYSISELQSCEKQIYDDKHKYVMENISVMPKNLNYKYLKKIH